MYNVLESASAAAWAREPFSSIWCSGKVWAAALSRDAKLRWAQLRTRGPRQRSICTQALSGKVPSATR
eukprot:2359093-Pyramimonas_sp.AAC.1